MRVYRGLTNKFTVGFRPLCGPRALMSLSRGDDGSIVFSTRFPYLSIGDVSPLAKLLILFAILGKF